MTSKKLGSFAGLTLYEDRIVTQDGTSPLSPEVRADCDTAGNLSRSSRVTVTRLATMGIFALAFKKKKTHDDRELYLVVESPTLMSVKKLDPKQGEAARRFASSIVNAGKQAAGRELARATETRAAEEALRHARANTEPVEMARAELERAEAETADVERWETELNERRAVLGPS